MEQNPCLAEVQGEKSKTSWKQLKISTAKRKRHCTEKEIELKKNKIKALKINWRLTDSSNKSKGKRDKFEKTLLKIEIRSQVEELKI
jgi:hypothetical protein